VWREKMGKIVPRREYETDPSYAAIMLLGKNIVRRVSGTTLVCMITETEAYYGYWDPSSRARNSGDLRRVMYSEPGLALVYGIHRQWMFNIVAHEEGDGGAVLIRSCMPLKGIETMVVNRGVNIKEKLTTGPGRLTKALQIDKSFHGKPVYTRKYGLWIEHNMKVAIQDIVTSHRIGVKEDLDKPLRYYIRGNMFVSKR
jgi:DNA-3-methyladenine glycosylase